MEYDKSGFPIPPGFDESRRPPVRPQITRGRMGVLGMVIGLGLVLALLASFGPALLDGVRDIFPVGTRNDILRRIQILLVRGDVDRALAECDRLIELEPKDGRMIKAQIYSEFGRYKESALEYGKLIQLDPQNAAFHNNRAYHLALAKIELDDAMKDVEKALQLAGDVPAYVDTRGYLHYLTGNFDAALADYNKVLDSPEAIEEMQGPELGEIYFHRGLVYRQMRDVDKAERDFSVARRLGFKSEEYPEPVTDPKENEGKAPPQGKPPEGLEAKVPTSTS